MTMSNKDRFKRLISVVAAVLLLGMLTGVFAFIWYRYYSETIMLPFYRRGNWTLIAIYTIMTAVFFKAYGGFKLGYLKKTDMFYSQLISMACVNVITYFIVSLIGRDFMFGTPIVMMMLADILVLAVWTFISGRIFFLLYPPRKLVILYGSHQAASLVLKMSQRVDKYMICESVSVNEETERIRELILKYEGVIICDIPAEMRNKFLKFCYDNSIRAYIAPKISDIIVRGADEIRLFDSPLLLCRNYGLDVEQELVKRVFDIVFSILMLVLASPFMLAAAIAVKLCDGGRVLYKQTRLTKDGKQFELYKFRSMVADAEKNGIPQLCSDDDSRITSVGKFLRKCRMDELPQIINILKGDMSIVGPRPERPELTEEYKKEMPEFEFRLKVKAGLTGLAQVTGVYDTTPYDKLKMDLMYIENYSLRLDLQIILMTIKTMLFPGKTNAETEEQLFGGELQNNRKEETR